MPRPTPRYVPIQRGSQAIRIEYNKTERCWMVWLSANADFTCGTFLRLSDDGKAARVTWHEDDTESVYEL